MLISIITVNRNNLEGLKKTAMSILAQTCKDYEWIIIDGGSTDGSKEYIESIVSDVYYWVSEDDKGIYNAMNKGIKKANGQYLHFLNAGDCYMKPDIIDLFKKSSYRADVVYGDTECVYLDNTVAFTMHPPYPYGLVDFFNSNICQQSIFYSRHCFEDEIFDETYHICADYKFNLRLFLANYTFLKLPWIISRFNVEGVSHRDLPLSSKETYRCLREALPSVLYDEMERYIEYIRFINSDIGKKCYEIINSNKFMRYLLRLFLYPIHWIGIRFLHINR